MARKPSSKPADATANLGFQARLWITTDKLRNNMDAAEYEHVLVPCKGRILVPACGSAAMFVQSESFLLIHGGRIGGISKYGQESNAPDAFRRDLLTAHSRN